MRRRDPAIDAGLEADARWRARLASKEGRIDQCLMLRLVRRRTASSVSLMVDRG
jgi:hypothetical protein